LFSLSVSQSPTPASLRSLHTHTGCLQARSSPLSIASIHPSSAAFSRAFLSSSSPCAVEEFTQKGQRKLWRSGRAIDAGKILENFETLEDLKGHAGVTLLLQKDLFPPSSSSPHTEFASTTTDASDGRQSTASEKAEVERLDSREGRSLSQTEGREGRSLSSHGRSANERRVAEADARVEDAAASALASAENDSAEAGGMASAEREVDGECL
jgi:hypothetical protein